MKFISHSMAHCELYLPNGQQTRITLHLANSKYLNNRINDTSTQQLFRVSNNPFESDKSKCKTILAKHFDGKLMKRDFRKIWMQVYNLHVG